MDGDKIIFQKHNSDNPEESTAEIGIIRRVDELGRVVLPCELRRVMNIREKDSMEIYTDTDKIILKKYEPACIFTGNAEDCIEYMGRKISKTAIKEMAALAGLRQG